MGADYYKLLGIDKNAGEDDIKKAYKKMVSSGR
jgi:DnaJ family protein B protein 4